MLSIVDIKVKKAADGIIKFAETLAATLEGSKNDLLVAAIWFSMKEEQERVKRLEDVLKQSTKSSVSNESSKPGVKVVTVTSGQTQKKVASPHNKGKVSASTVAKPVGVKPVAADKNSSKAARRESSDSDDVCIIEIDDTDDVTDSVPKTKKNEKDKSENKSVLPNYKVLKTMLTDEGKGKEIQVEKAIKTDKNDTEDHELFDMDCEEIHEETNTSKTEETETKSESQSTGNASENVTINQDITVISDEEEETNKAEYTIGSKRGRDIDSTSENDKDSGKPGKKAKKKKGKIAKKNTEEKSEKSSEVSERTNSDDDSGKQNSSIEIKSVPEPDTLEQSQDVLDKNADINVKTNESQPFPTGLTENLVNKTHDGTIGPSELLSHPVRHENESLSNIIAQSVGLSRTQPLESGVIEGDHMLGQSVSESLLSPGAEVRDNTVTNQPAYLGEQGSVSDTIFIVKTEVDSGMTDEQSVPVCIVQGAPYIGPSISTHQLTAIPTDSLSLSSLSSGALTFPYSSTSFGAPVSTQYRSLPIPDVQSQVQGTPYIGPSISTHQLTAMPTDSLSLSSLSSGALTFPYSSTGFGAAASSQYRSLPIPDVQSQGLGVSYDGHLQQQASGTQDSFNQGSSQQVSIHETSEDTVSPPVKIRLLDFDKKWHEGPSSSKGQERYIAPPAFVLNDAPLPWGGPEPKMTETEWSLRFQSYQSVSNDPPPQHHPVEFQIGQNVVETETVGVSLDDIGFYHQESNNADDELEKETKAAEKSRKGNSKKRGGSSKKIVKGKGVPATKGKKTVGSKRQSNSSSGTKSSHDKGSNVKASKGATKSSVQFSFFKRGTGTGSSPSTSRKSAAKASVKSVKSAVNPKPETENKGAKRSGRGKAANKATAGKGTSKNKSSETRLKNVKRVSKK